MNLTAANLPSQKRLNIVGEESNEYEGIHEE